LQSSEYNARLQETKEAENNLETGRGLIENTLNLKKSTPNTFE
jgi:hypothetical protein